LAGDKQNVRDHFLVDDVWFKLAHNYWHRCTDSLIERMSSSIDIWSSRSAQQIKLLGNVEKVRLILNLSKSSELRNALLRI
jgi:hypothetical protein